MSGYGNFNPAPVIQISSTPADCLAGWPEIFAELHRRIPAGRKCLLALECYPGISLHKLKAEAERAFPGAQIFNVEEAYRPASVLQAELAPVLSDDPVFGFMQPWPVANYFMPSDLQHCNSLFAIIRRSQSSWAPALCGSQPRPTC